MSRILSPQGQRPWLQHAMKQAKFVALGLLGMYELSWRDSFAAVASSQCWHSYILRLSYLLQIVTAMLFLYLVAWLPLVKGHQPDYANGKWMQSYPLRTIIPLITLTLISGVSTCAVALSSAFGFFHAIGLTLSSWGLMIGLIGLVPSK